MYRTIDQMGREVALSSFPPQRIISLVPSQTELLFDLGLRHEVVGITKFCLHPAAFFRSKPRIGGTKQVHLERVATLQPDLIIGNKEENDQVQIEALAEHYPVWMSDIYTLADALAMIHAVGNLVDRSEPAHTLTTEITRQFDALPHVSPQPRAAYLIWQEPLMVAAGQTFIDDMLGQAGFTNVFANLSRYPAITLDDLQESNPDLLFLSSEPYPFREKHLEAFQQQLPDTQVRLVDGEMFSWYGSRLLQAPAYFQQLMLSIER
ncbi:MAG: ABC transporter substrate-binding protein [Lewinellaceae bacterium]|nr:ABC transporter substrate-binding protein [Lewinellaceae bacterium]